jgi:hypothetical protein
VERGYLKRPVNWKEFAIVSRLDSPMVIPGLSPDQLQYWKKTAYRRFYLRPRYLYRKLRKIRNVSDIRDILRGLKIFSQVAG